MGAWLPHTPSFYAWVCSPLLLYMRAPGRNMTPPLSPPAMLSTMPYWQWMLCWMNRWMEEGTMRIRTNSKLTFNITWVNLLCRKGVWVCSWSSARIHSFSCKQEAHQTSCNERVTDQIFLIFKRKSILKKKLNALVVSCSTREIKLDWDTLCWLCLGKGPQLKSSK